jgi:transcriptional regulator with XRE-family HTH domain
VSGSAHIVCYHDVVATAAETLRDARHRAGLTQRELARRVGIPSTVLSAYERGRREPGAEVFLALVRAAGFDMAWVRRLDDRRQGQRLAQVLELAEALPYRPRAMPRPRLA